MKNDWKNNSSIYLSNNSKIYQYFLYPILILLFLLIIFLIFGKIEIVIKGNARIVGKESIIQTENEEDIVHNYLKENKEVKKGETLVTYNKTKFITEIKRLNKKIESFEDEENAIKKFKLSLENNKNNFIQPDEYGYYNKFKEYQLEINNIEKKIKLLDSNNNIKKQNRTATINEFDYLIEEKNKYLNDVIRLRNAISENKTYFDVSYENLNSKFNLFQENLNSTDDKDKQKITYISELDSEIQQLNLEIDNLNLNKIQNTQIEINQEDPNSLIEEQKKLKETYLSEIGIKLNELTKQKNEIIEEKRTLQTTEDTFEIKAPSDGTIHLNKEINITSTYIPKGTTIATLFIADDDTTRIEAKIPANEINKINTGDKFKLELDQKGISRKILNGKISSISQTSIIAEEGVFYQIEGVLDENIKSIKYGEIGRLSIIVGKKNYLNYIKDILF